MAGPSARAGFAKERVGVAILSLGIINECLRLSVDYARTRTLWGKAIGELQLIQAKLAEMEVARINVQNMVFQTLDTRSRYAAIPGRSVGYEALLVRAATEVAMEAVQLFGGNGYMAEFRVEQLARDAKSLMIYAGSNEIQYPHRQGLARRMNIRTAKGLRRSSMAAVDRLSYVPISRLGFNMMLNVLVSQQWLLAALRPAADYVISRTAPVVPGIRVKPCFRAGARGVGLGSGGRRRQRAWCWCCTAAAT